MKRLKPNTVLVASFVIAILISIWGIAFNYAYLEVESEITPFYLQYSDTKKECELSECKLKLKPRTYTITISADQHTDQTENLNLKRGETVNISYTPVSLPVLRKTKEVSDYKEAYLDLEEGQQNLYLRTEDRGDLHVSTFKTPLVNPVVVVSPSKKLLLVWDEDVYPRQLFLVNSTDFSKQSISNPELLDFSQLAFLDDEQLLLENENGVYIYNMLDASLANLPISTLSHFLIFQNNKSILLSSEELDDYNLGETGLSLGELLDTTDKEGELVTDADSTYKLYYYLYKEDKFLRLLELGSEFKEPLRLFRSGDVHEQEIILQSNDNYYLLELNL